MIKGWCIFCGYPATHVCEKCKKNICNNHWNYESNCCEQCAHAEEEKEYSNKAIFHGEKTPVRTRRK